ncbi:hypothetical protein EST38_g6174 [Candolleomyces aberdarensis]|uniref:BTB domain-containing protein n=1 Tax=Candolleomyces aberdarensis TaxID=2316362 RepID=A0A4V1Q3T1_9AGAR|nr:hypothetical protein EST38_g6174 [Candolleomyces aberdarensis]
MSPTTQADSDSNSSQPSLAEPSPPLQHHSKYFFDDDLVIFEVESTLFRVHKHYLIKESEVFQSMFSCPPDAAGPEGKTVDRPIVLPEVKVLEFEALLDVFYERGYRQKEPRIGLPPSWFPGEDVIRLGVLKRSQLHQRLQGLLSVANRFGFEEIKDLAVKAFEKEVLVELDPVDKILLARQFDVSDWLKPAYVNLCQRSKPLSTTEAGRLGAETAALIAQARETYRDSRAYTDAKTSYNPVAFELLCSRVRNLELDREAEVAVRTVFFPQTDAPLDETGIDPKDIELVIQQAGCSRAVAVKALKDYSGDLINAIMAAA